MEHCDDFFNGYEPIDLPDDSEAEMYAVFNNQNE